MWPRPLRRLLRQVRRGEQLAAELVRRAHVDQVPGADRRHDLVAQRADGAVRVGRRVVGGGALRDLGDELAGVELPLLPPAVEQLHVVVPVDLEVPVCVGGEPVVVPAVEHDRVIVADAPLGQQRLETCLVHEVTADMVLQILLPVELDRVADVALVVGRGVLVHLDEHDIGDRLDVTRPSPRPRERQNGSCLNLLVRSGGRRPRGRLSGFVGSSDTFRSLGRSRRPR